MKRYNMITDEEIKGRVRILSVKDYVSSVGKWTRYTDHEEQHQKDLQVMVVQQAEIKKLKEQNNKMLERLKMRVAYLVKHDFLSCNHIDEENELRNLIEKIEGGK